MTTLTGIVDGAMEFAVVPSFSRLGIVTRRRLEHWNGAASRYDGLTAVVTGATSGLGMAAAHELAARGSSVVLVGRNRSKTEAVAADIEARGAASVTFEIADLSDLTQVAELSSRLNARLDRIDVLAHVAGTMLEDRETSADGYETTVAVSVLAPFLLTRSTLPLLQESPSGRVLTMSSGGMYTAPLRVEGLQMSPADYSGVRQYALAKRAQVTLNELWAAHHVDTGVSFQALHPGWADTPGLETALPAFRGITRPLLRTPAEGADTLVWLGGADLSDEASGGFWHDRHRRPIHRLESTRRTDTRLRRRRFWDWCESCV